MLDNLFVRHIDLQLSSEEKTRYIDMMILDHKNHDYRYDNNFCLDDKYEKITSKIYNDFEYESRKLFKEIILSDRSNKNCWAYITNNHEYRKGIHDHKRSATINAVYYFKVPTQTSGQINFYNDDMQIIHSHFPKEGELLIFPYYLLHEPQRSLSEEYRIAINVEIICNEVWN